MIYWPVWATVAKALITFTAAAGLQNADPALAKKFIAAFTEGTFFWCSISAWVWQTLIFGNYGKYSLGDLQPRAGIWYTFLSFVCGAFAFLFLIFISLHFSVVISKITDRNKELAQRYALLEIELRELKKKKVLPEEGGLANK
jgi:hypothetical protein